MSLSERPAADLALLDGLARRVQEVLATVVPAGSEVALLDVPDHTNVGDHAITVGELTALRRGAYRLVFASSLKTASPKWLGSRVRDAVILMHGGGNLGDLWPEHQHYRQEVLRQLRHRKVVQLPQSLAFERRETLLSAQRAFDAHPDFTLIVRDEVSLDFALRHFSCRTELCPDSALALGPLARPSPPSQDILCLARYDHERISGDDIGLDAVDWPRPLDRREALLARMSIELGGRVDGRSGPSPGAKRLVALLLERLARRRLHRGIHLLSRGGTVITDRLHAHLLALLLGIPNLVADTRSGKVHDFVDTWTGSSSLVRRAESLGDALRIARGH